MFNYHILKSPSSCICISLFPPPGCDAVEMSVGPHVFYYGIRQIPQLSVTDSTEMVKLMNEYFYIINIYVLIWIKNTGKMLNSIHGSSEVF